MDPVWFARSSLHSYQIVLFFSAPYSQCGVLLKGATTAYETTITQTSFPIPTVSSISCVLI